MREGDPCPLPCSSLIYPERRAPRASLDLLCNATRLVSNASRHARSDPAPIGLMHPSPNGAASSSSRCRPASEQIRETHRYTSANNRIRFRSSRPPIDLEADPKSADPSGIDAYQSVTGICREEPIEIRVSPIRVSPAQTTRAPGRWVACRLIRGGDRSCSAKDLQLMSRNDSPRPQISADCRKLL